MNKPFLGPAHLTKNWVSKVLPARPVCGSQAGEGGCSRRKREGVVLHVLSGMGEAEEGLVTVGGPPTAWEAGALEMCLKEQGDLTLHFWFPSWRC